MHDFGALSFLSANLLRTVGEPPASANQSIDANLQQEMREVKRNDTGTHDNGKR